MLCLVIGAVSRPVLRLAFRLRRLGPLRVVSGQSIETGDLGQRDRGEASRIATERLREAIGGLERAVGSAPGGGAPA